MQARRFVPSDLQEAQGGHYERLKMTDNNADALIGKSKTSVHWI